MICKNCGNKLKDGVLFCSKCGKPVTDMPHAQQQPAAKKKNVAMIAMIALLVVLAIVVVVLAVIFFRGLSSGGGSDDGGGNDTAIIEEDDRRDGGDDDKDELADSGEGDEEDGSEDDASAEGSGVKDTPASKKKDDDLFAGGQDGKKEQDRESDPEEDVDALFNGDDEDYILPDSSTRRLTEEDLEEIADDARMLQLARNEIYARHGRLFQTSWIQAYFDNKDWYDGYIEPDEFDEDDLSRIEKANIKLIKEFEEKL